MYSEWISIIAGIVGVAVGAAGAIFSFYSRSRARSAENRVEQINIAQNDRVKEVSQKNLNERYRREGNTRSNFDLLWRGVETGSSDLKLPDIPPALIDTLSSQRCLLFIGTGASVYAGMPTRKEILARILLETRNLNEERIRSDLARLDENDIVDLGEVWLGRKELGMRVAKAVRQAEDECMARSLAPQIQTTDSLRRKTRQANSSPSSLHAAISKLPVVGLVTDAWDGLHAPGFSGLNPVDLKLEDPKAAAILSSERFFTTRLFGSAEDPESLVLSVRELKKKVDEWPTFRRTLASIVGRYSILFVGTSPSFIDNFAQLLTPSSLGDSTGRHFAIFPAYDGVGLDVERMRSVHRVECIILDPASRLVQLTDYINKLSNESVQPLDQRTTRKSRGQQDIILSVSLRRIGPFRELDLEMDSSWNVILGDNGSGKSTLLRAIAFALSRSRESVEDGDEFLLSADATRGSIKIEMNSGVYEVDLVRDTDGVRCLSRQITPVEAGSFLALGFPALRGVAIEKLRGPRYVRSQSPGRRDLDALARGFIDSRLDDLKQWIINLNVSRDTEASSAILKRFFRLLNALMPGPAISLDRVDEKTWDVLVRTPDGVVPIERLSQGMSSMLCWCGVLLQRLHDVLPSGLKSGDDTGERALALIDEIDAHLHPKWQRRIISILREQFPQVQFVVTSHSPLIVGNMHSQEVTYFVRENDGSGITARKVNDSFKGMRADQILMSAVFDLPITSNPESEAEINEYGALVSKLTITEPERSRMLELRRRLREGPLSPYERTEARTAHEIISEVAAERLNAMPLDERRRVSEEIRRQLSDLGQVRDNID